MVVSLASYIADLNSIIRDGVSEKEKQSSSSESSACLVGTTTQESEKPPHANGKSSLNITGRMLICLKYLSIVFYKNMFLGLF